MALNSYNTVSKLDHGWPNHHSVTAPRREPIHNPSVSSGLRITGTGTSPNVGIGFWPWVGRKATGNGPVGKL